MTILAAAAEPDAGWGRLIALVAAAAIFWAGTVVHTRWKAAKDDSPTTDDSGSDGAKPQVSATDDTNGTTVGRGARLQAWVRARTGRARTMDIVNDAQRHFRVSRRTAMRAVAAAKREREPESTS